MFLNLNLNKYYFLPLKQKNTNIKENLKKHSNFLLLFFNFLKLKTFFKSNWKEEENKSKKKKIIIIKNKQTKTF